MYTQCPDCNTIFRVSDEQLQIAGGKVRCGHCMAVFQAREHEVDELPGAAASPPPPPPPSAIEESTPSAPALEEETPLALDTTPAEMPQSSTEPPPLAEVEMHPALDEAATAELHDTPMEFDFEDLLAAEEPPQQEPGFGAPLDELDLADVTPAAPAPEPEAEPEQTAGVEPFSEPAPIPTEVEAASGEVDEFDLSAPETVTSAPEPVTPAWGGDTLGEAEIESLLHTDEELPEPETTPPAAPPEPTDEAAAGPADTGESVTVTADEFPLSIDLADEEEAARFDETLREVEALAAQETAGTAPPDTAPTAATDAGIPEPQEDEEAPEEVATGTPRKGPGLFSSLVWSLLILTLLATLLLQYTYLNRDTLATYPPLRPWLTRLCEVAQCSIPPRRDLKAIEIIERQIQTHPRYRNALLISATLVNQAAFAQPFPQVEVVLEDVNGKVLASRIFKPSEYLVERGEKSFAPHAQAHLQLQVADPNRQAVSFEFKFY